MWSYKPGRRLGWKGMVNGAFIMFGMLGGHVFTEVGQKSVQEALPCKKRFQTRECVEVGVQSHHMKQ